VTRLRADGALVLGRTVRAETAHLAPGSAAPGAAGPATRAGTPSLGLHQGCAVAVAAGLCPLAVAWLSPATAGVASRALSPTGSQVMGIPWTHAGLPTLSLPAGRDAAGLPVGLQIAGRWGADDEVLAWAWDIARIAAL
jgi:Asp-tRNA(Asn)/Glu-tRNA(Gln) amidotransferase A subunit family amidase